MPQNQQENDVQAKRTRENILGVVVNVVLIIAIIVAFLCTYTAYVTKNGSGVPDILGYEPFSIQSDSMSPFFEKGDLVIDKRVEDTSKLKEGDVITFWTIIDGQKVLNTHRIIEVQEGDNFRYFVTKGDNNSVEDSLTVHESEIVGIYHTHIKNLGGVLDFLQTSKGFFCIIVLPVFAFFLYYLVSFFRVLFEYQAEKRKLLYEQELIASGRMSANPENASVNASAAEEKPAQEVLNRFLEKHQGKKNGGKNTIDSAAQQELLKQMQEMQKQMEQLRQQNTAQLPNVEPQQPTQSAQPAATSQQPVQPVQPVATSQQQAQTTAAPQQSMQQDNDEKITLTKEQLLALLGQAGVQETAKPGVAPRQPVQTAPVNVEPQQPVQPVQTVASQQQAQTGASNDSISMSKSEFVDLLSLAMKKAKDEE